MMASKKEQKRKPSTTEEFEEAIKNEDKRRFTLRLFVTGITPKSIEAINQVRSLCEEHLKGRYELEVIDLYKQPKEARTDQIFAAPTLVKLLPLPVRKIVGDMTKEEKLLAGLDIEIKPEQ
ncbi:circadian clock protein KaiB [Chitinispirillum alkaliphilum]|nr:circadian clock protein KaiB [Chitinispirillum alkaliphilum]